MENDQKSVMPKPGQNSLLYFHHDTYCNFVTKQDHKYSSVFFNLVFGKILAKSKKLEEQLFYLPAAGGIPNLSNRSSGVSHSFGSEGSSSGSSGSFCVNNDLILSLIFEAEILLNIT